MVIITGGIDLGSGSVLALAAVIATSLAQLPESATLKYEGLSVPILLPVVAALAVGALTGVINGSLISKFKIPPFIATLGMMTVARGFALIYSNKPLSQLTPEYNFIGQGALFGVPFPVIILVVHGARRGDLCGRGCIGEGAVGRGLRQGGGQRCAQPNRAAGLAMVAVADARHGGAHREFRNRSPFQVSTPSSLHGIGQYLVRNDVVGDMRRLRSHIRNMASDRCAALYNMWCRATSARHFLAVGFFRLGRRRPSWKGSGARSASGD